MHTDNLHRPLHVVLHITYLSLHMEGRSCLTQGRLAIRTKLRDGREGEAISHWAESTSFVSVPPVTWLMMNNPDTPHVWHLLETLGQFVIQYLNFLSTFLYISCCVRCCSAVYRRRCLSFFCCQPCCVKVLRVIWIDDGPFSKNKNVVS
jgi:hypothetical protein